MFEYLVLWPFFDFFSLEGYEGKFACFNWFLVNRWCLEFISVIPVAGPWGQLPLRTPQALWIGGATKHWWAICSYRKFPQGGSTSSCPTLVLLLLLLLSRFSRVRLCATPLTAAHQAPPTLGFSRKEHWSVLPFPSPMHESEKWKWRRSVVSDSSQPHGLQPTRLLHPWDFPGKSTGVGCHCLLQTLVLPAAKP